MDTPQIKKTIIKLAMLIAIAIIGYFTLGYIYNKKYDINKDKFNDLILNDVSVGDQVNSNIFTYYNCYFNKNTTDNLLSGSNIANANYVNNSATIVSKLNELSSNIDTLMVQLNNDILNNIEDNYARAHLLNKHREEMKQSLNDLPLKNI